MTKIQTGTASRNLLCRSRQVSVRSSRFILIAKCWAGLELSGRAFPDIAESRMPRWWCGLPMDVRVCL